MKITKIKRSFSMKKKTKIAYEMIDFYAEYEAEIEDGESVSKMSSQLHEACRRDVEMDYQMYLHKGNKIEETVKDMTEKLDKATNFEEAAY